MPLIWDDCQESSNGWRGPTPTESTASPTAIADAIAELELYDDEEHRAVLQLVREILDLDATAVVY